MAGAVGLAAVAAARLVRRAPATFRYHPRPANRLSRGTACVIFRARRVAVLPKPKQPRNPKNPRIAAAMREARKKTKHNQEVAGIAAIAAIGSRGASLPRCAARAASDAGSLPPNARGGEPAKILRNGKTVRPETEHTQLGAGVSSVSGNDKAKHGTTFVTGMCRARMRT